jgi:hypothetical protein
MQRVARLDPTLEAVLVDLVPLTYDDGGRSADDRPANVRAASAIRRHGSRLAIVQDDVNVLALIDEAGATSALLLPLGAGRRRCFDDSRGNKHDKMDLEACVILGDGRLVAFGSGSTAVRRQLVVADRGGSVRVVNAAELYAELERHRDFAGSELNVEGAIVLGDRLRLFQRGNGEEREGLSPVNAFGDVSLPAFVRWLDSGGPFPALEAIVSVDLGSIGARRFGFTDATPMLDGRVAFMACAEDSPDVVRDGPVLGCRFGIIEMNEVRMTDVVDVRGSRSTLKIEGIEAREDGAFDVVADVDDPTIPALLGRLELRSKE